MTPSPRSTLLLALLLVPSIVHGADLHRVQTAPRITHVTVYPDRAMTNRNASLTLKPGSYLVGYRTLDKTDDRMFVRITVTDLCLSTIEEENAVVFVVSSLKTGLAIRDR